MSERWIWICPGLVDFMLGGGRARDRTPQYGAVLRHALMLPGE